VEGRTDLRWIISFQYLKAVRLKNPISVLFATHVIMGNQMNNDGNYIPEGCILLARRVQKSDIWNKPADWLKIWVYILQEVNHSDDKPFPRGSNFFNFRDEARHCGVKYWTWVNCIQWLKSTRQITTRKTTRGVVVSIVNYEQYQNLENYKNKTENNTSDKSETSQQQVGTNTINKNEKNGKNVKNDNIYIPEFDESLDCGAIGNDHGETESTRGREVMPEKSKKSNKEEESEMLDFMFREFERISDRRACKRKIKNRSSKLLAAIKDFGEEDLRKSWQHMSEDAFLRGENKNGKDYMTIDYALRTDKIEEHLEPPKKSNQNPNFAFIK